MPENTGLRSEMEAEAALVSMPGVGAKGWQSRVIICLQQLQAVSRAARHLLAFKARCPSSVLSVESLIIPQSL